MLGYVAADMHVRSVTLAGLVTKGPTLIIFPGKIDNDHFKSLLPFKHLVFSVPCT